MKCNIAVTTCCDSDECHEVKVVHVKTKKVGYLIGHHGRTIKGFENSSGAKIDILVANSMSDETPVNRTQLSSIVMCCLFP